MSYTYTARVPVFKVPKLATSDAMNGKSATPNQGPAPHSARQLRPRSEEYSFNEQRKTARGAATARERQRPTTTSESELFNRRPETVQKALREARQAGSRRARRVRGVPSTSDSKPGNFARVGGAVNDKLGKALSGWSFANTSTLPDYEAYDSQGGPYAAAYASTYTDGLQGSIDPSGADYLVQESKNSEQQVPVGNVPPQMPPLTSLGLTATPNDPWRVSRATPRQSHTAGTEGISFARTPSERRRRHHRHSASDGAADENNDELSAVSPRRRQTEIAPNSADAVGNAGSSRRTFVPPSSSSGSRPKGADATAGRNHASRRSQDKQRRGITDQSAPSPPPRKWSGVSEHSTADDSNFMAYDPREFRTRSSASDRMDGQHHDSTAQSLGKDRDPMSYVEEDVPEDDQEDDSSSRFNIGDELAGDASSGLGDLDLITDDSGSVPSAASRPSTAASARMKSSIAMANKSKFSQDGDSAQGPDTDLPVSDRQVVVMKASGDDEDASDDEKAVQKFRPNGPALKRLPGAQGGPGPQAPAARKTASGSNVSALISEVGKDQEVELNEEGISAASGGAYDMHMNQPHSDGIDESQGAVDRRPTRPVIVGANKVFDWSTVSSAPHSSVTSDKQGSRSLNQLLEIQGNSIWSEALRMAWQGLVSCTAERDTAWDDCSKLKQKLHSTESRLDDLMSELLAPSGGSTPQHSTSSAASTDSTGPVLLSGQDAKKQASPPSSQLRKQLSATAMPAGPADSGMKMHRQLSIVLNGEDPSSPSKGQVRGKFPLRRGQTFLATRLSMLEEKLEALRLKEEDMAKREKALAAEEARVREANHRIALEWQQLSELSSDANSAPFKMPKSARSSEAAKEARLWQKTLDVGGTISGDSASDSEPAVTPGSASDVSIFPN